MHDRSSPSVATSSVKARLDISRVERPNPIAFILWVLVIGFIVWSLTSTAPTWERLLRGIPSMFSVVERMFPPDIERLDRILWSLLVTFQMAVAGTIIGLVLSVPLAILAADGLSPHPVARSVARGLIAFFRTVPDLVWALLFVIAVGLGPPAGVMAIAVDTIGFAGRFFAEAMEEADKGPQEALSSIGASRLGMIFSAVIPQAAPNFIATSLFSIEKATRSSVILGLVGAGGIGVELKVAFDLFDYDTACTIIIVIFLLVLLVEQAGATLRRRII
jgi:phosphonate transport system permease protein